MIFNLQSYVNKELVIIYREDDVQTSSLLERLYAADLLLIKVPKSRSLTLGQLRNLGIKQCNGELICCWDDDDWYHFRRLEVQFAVMKVSKLKGCVLSKILTIDMQSKQVYCSHERLWEGSLMCYRSVFIEHAYANLQRGEDFELVINLQSKNLLYVINTVPDLYVYNYHGANTWNIGHFSYFFMLSESLSKETSLKIVDLMNSTDIKQVDSLTIGSLIGNQVFE